MSFFVQEKSRLFISRGMVDRNPRGRNGFSVNMFAGLSAISLERGADRCLFERVVCSGEIVVMPIYEYVCGRCGHQFELLVRSEEKPLCPSCHAMAQDWRTPTEGGRMPR